MLYTTNFVTVKNNDWKVVSVTGVDGVQLTNASVNRVNKKNEVFPGFDEIQAGRTFEAEPWQSPKGVWYLFAPKPVNAPKTTYTPRQAKSSYDPVKAATITKESVSVSQDRKEELEEKKQEAIRKGDAQRGAVAVVTNLYPELSELVANKDEIIRDKVDEWMRYFMNKGEQPFL